jgi:hypothetical protein
MQIPYKTKNRASIGSSDTVLRIFPKNVSQATLEAAAHPCSLQHDLQQPSYGNSQDAPQLMKGLRKCGMNSLLPVPSWEAGNVFLSSPLPLFHTSTCYTKINP